MELSNNFVSTPSVTLLLLQSCLLNKQPNDLAVNSICTIYACCWYWTCCYIQCISRATLFYKLLF